MKDYTATVTVKIPVAVTAKDSAEARRLAAEAVEQMLARLPGAAIAGAALERKSAPEKPPAPPPDIDLGGIKEKLHSLRSRESALDYLAPFAKRELAAIARHCGLRSVHRPKAVIADRIVQRAVVARLYFAPPTDAGHAGRV